MGSFNQALVWAKNAQSGKPNAKTFANKLFGNYVHLISENVNGIKRRYNVEYSDAVLQEICRRQLIKCIREYNDGSISFEDFVNEAMQKKLEQFLKKNPNPIIERYTEAFIDELKEAFNAHVEPEEYNKLIYCLETLPSNVKVLVKRLYYDKASMETVVAETNITEEEIKGYIGTVETRLHKEFHGGYDNDYQLITFYFPNHTIDQIKAAIKELSSTSRERIYLCFGEKLNKKQFIYKLISSYLLY